MFATRRLTREQAIHIGTALALVFELAAPHPDDVDIHMEIDRLDVPIFINRVKCFMRMRLSHGAGGDGKLYVQVNPIGRDEHKDRAVESWFCRFLAAALDMSEEDAQRYLYERVDDYDDRLEQLEDLRKSVQREFVTDERALVESAQALIGARQDCVEFLSRTRHGEDIDEYVDGILTSLSFVEKDLRFASKSLHFMTQGDAVHGRDARVRHKSEHLRLLMKITHTHLNAFKEFHPDYVVKHKYSGVCAAADRDARDARGRDVRKRYRSAHSAGADDSR